MSFSVAQAILIVLIVAIVIYMFTMRSVSRDRALMLVLAFVGALFVVWPGLSTDVAHAVGVGRGTDLLFYLFVVFCLFRFVSTASQIRGLNDRLTALVRDSALRTARPAPADAPVEARSGGDVGRSIGDASVRGDGV